LFNAYIRYMKKTTYFLPLLFTFGAVAPVSATPLIGTELAKFSVLAGGYSTYGAGSVVGGEVGGVSYVTGEAGSSSAGDRTNTAGVRTALTELATAQQALNNMGAGTVLGTTMAGNQSLRAGVYSASALTLAAGTILTLDGGGADNPYWVFNIPTYLATGAMAKIEIINAGANASVVWNTGGYTTMGAATSFIGTVLTGAYISQGAGSEFGCGNLFAASYVSIGAESQVTSTNCLGKGSWEGSKFGMAAGLEIVDGVAQARMALPAAAEIPEPGTVAMLLLGLGLIGVASKAQLRQGARPRGAETVAH
jgi:hypothetical protein